MSVTSIRVVPPVPPTTLPAAGEPAAPSSQDKFSPRTRSAIVTIAPVQKGEIAPIATAKPLAMGKPNRPLHTRSVVAVAPSKKVPGEAVVGVMTAKPIPPFEDHLAQMHASTKRNIDYMKGLWGDDWINHYGEPVPDHVRNAPLPDRMLLSEQIKDFPEVRKAGSREEIYVNSRAALYLQMARGCNAKKDFSKALGFTEKGLATFVPDKATRQFLYLEKGKALYKLGRRSEAEQAISWGKLGGETMLTDSIMHAGETADPTIMLAFDLESLQILEEERAYVALTNAASSILYHTTSDHGLLPLLKQTMRTEDIEKVREKATASLAKANGALKVEDETRRVAIARKSEKLLASLN